ncbi:helix-turn-helix domain-containing protein [Streptomyces sp. PTM05]|uniref:Helix-turn-helix domain-containing protein n=1 Tax=Streptantibioticus parmotrematis TaxID=2873249 RepID=A0ABS7QNZ6_9ACTN|nr:helix-turn-helix transcriptional regulator [Streptantibioticus parmotrematis]MBY8884900.1 helix-turn-helix domain-containing protein [Streptantibioticus parmotrematis]
MDVHKVVGERIAKARRRKYWYQRELALAIGKGESWVSQIERGALSLDSMKTAEKIAEVLGLSVPYVLAFDVRCPDYRPVPDATRSDDLPAAAVDLTDSDIVLRRTFLSTSAGVAATAAVPHEEHGSGLDSTTMTDLRSTSTAYRRAYRAVPAEALLPAARAQVHLVHSLRPEAQPDRQRRELLRQLSEMAALTGIMSYMDAGDERTGRAYLDLAHRAAKAVGSADLLAMALATKAFVNSYTGDPDGGLDCALAAVDHAEHGTDPRMHGWVLAVCSEMHASLGEERECRLALDRSRQIIDGLDPDPVWSGIGWYDMAKADAYDGGDLVRLGRYREALPCLNAALASLTPDMMRHRCTAHVDRAEAYAAAGEVDAAVEDAHTALTLLEQTHHANSLDRITRLHRNLRQRDSRATRTLAEHLIHTRALVSAGAPA